MLAEGTLPKLGSTAKTLGVRVSPMQDRDIPVGSDGTVRPGTGGMSVAPSLGDLPGHRIPKRLRPAIAYARGSNSLYCWRMGEGPFESAPLADGLNLRPDLKKANHGFVEPATIVLLGEFQACLEATRDQWTIDETIR
jgi:hypothetical protein